MKVKIPNSLNSRNFLNYFFPTQIEWFHNGTTMFTGSRYRMEHAYGFASLTILNLCPEDSGEYKIKATNNLGSCTSTWNINFSSRPKQIKASHQQSSPKLAYDPTLRGGSTSCCAKTLSARGFPPSHMSIGSSWLSSLIGQTGFLFLFNWRLVFCCRIGWFAFSRGRVKKSRVKTRKNEKKLAMEDGSFFI